MRAPWSYLEDQIAKLQVDIAQLRALITRPLALYLASDKGKYPMTNFEAANDTDYAIPIQATNAVGTIVPLPAGDTLSVSDSTGSDQGLLTIGLMPDGVTPALLINAAGHGMVSGVVATVSDSAGLTVATLTIDVIADQTPTALFIDVAEAVGSVPPAPAAT